MCTTSTSASALDMGGISGLTTGRLTEVEGPGDSLAAMMELKPREGKSENKKLKPDPERPYRLIWNLTTCWLPFSFGLGVEMDPGRI